MSTLKDQLRTDLTSAMKARDKERAGTLRMVMASITEAEVITILTREAKKRREAATAFADGGRAEQAEKETAEAAVITEYLPAQLSAEEISDLVSKAIAQTGAADEGMRAMGKVMGILTPQTKGKADGGAVAAEVRKQLA